MSVCTLPGRAWLSPKEGQKEREGKGSVIKVHRGIQHSLGLAIQYKTQNPFFKI